VHSLSGEESERAREAVLSVLGELRKSGGRKEGMWGGGGREG